MLPVAAHMKLLIDTPEALYSYLSHHDYLSAAFLWLVARVVKDSLSEMPDSANRVSCIGFCKLTTRLTYL